MAKVLSKVHYQIRFDRDLGSVDFWADDGPELAEQIFYHMRKLDPSFVWVGLTVDVDLVKLEGSINKGQYAMFKIDRLDP